MQELSKEYWAVREGGAGLIDLSARGRIRVTGSEATMFLNGLITNDIKNLGDNCWMPAVFPNVQGRLVGSVRIARTGDSFLIETEPASHEAVLKTVSRFTLAGDFKVSDVTSETALLTVQGKRAVEVVEKVAPVFDVPVTVMRATHTAEDGIDVIVHSNHKAKLWQMLIEA